MTWQSQVQPQISSPMILLPCTLRAQATATRLLFRPEANGPAVSERLPSALPRHLSDWHDE